MYKSKAIRFSVQQNEGKWCLRRHRAYDKRILLNASFDTEREAVKRVEEWSRILDLETIDQNHNLTEEERFFHQSWIADLELEELTGNILWKGEIFLGNSGGQPDPDSFRGFGATSQQWEVPTEKGWKIYNDDNGAGIYAALSPDGDYYRQQQLDHADLWYAKDEDIKKFNDWRDSLERQNRINILYRRYRVGLS